MSEFQPEVTAVEFGKYLAIQRSGVTNMFDIKVVQHLTGLDRNTILYIMKNYERLMEAYMK